MCVSRVSTEPLSHTVSLEPWFQDDQRFPRLSNISAKVVRCGIQIGKKNLTRMKVRRASKVCHVVLCEYVNLLLLLLCLPFYDAFLCNHQKSLSSLRPYTAQVLAFVAVISLWSFPALKLLHYWTCTVQSSRTDSNSRSCGSSGHLRGRPGRQRSVPR